MAKRLLDVFCSAGGASKGYKDAGFDVIVGVDNKYISNYPYTFIQADAIDYLSNVKYGDFDLIHTSPPCQTHSWASTQWNKGYDSLVEMTREQLLSIGSYYVIENVVGAPLIKNQTVILNGQMFNLNVVRKRLFETNWPLARPPGRPKRGSVCSHKLVTPAGHGGNGPRNYLAWATAMKIDWMTSDQIAQAIPPAYTKYIGKEFLEFYVD